MWQGHDLGQWGQYQGSDGELQGREHWTIRSQLSTLPTCRWDLAGQVGWCRQLAQFTGCGRTSTRTQPTTTRTSREGWPDLRTERSNGQMDEWRDNNRDHDSERWCDLEERQTLRRVAGGEQEAWWTRYAACDTQRGGAMEAVQSAPPPPHAIPQPCGMKAIWIAEGSCIDDISEQHDEQEPDGRFFVNPSYEPSRGDQPEAQGQTCWTRSPSWEELRRDEGIQVVATADWGRARVHQRRWWEHGQVRACPGQPSWDLGPMWWISYGQSTADGQMNGSRGCPDESTKR